jgi:uncharacterized damage-inducible protein DinB
MKASDFIMMSLEESHDYVAQALKGLSPDELAFRPRPHSNSIIFLLWHLARVEDLWINRILLGKGELYEVDGWYRKFGTPAADSGFGYDFARLDDWPVPALGLANDYAAAVRKATLAYLKAVKSSTMDEPRDFGWRRGTVGSALSHLVTEIAEHSGQIGYLRGIMKGIENPPPPPPRKA